LNSPSHQRKRFDENGSKAALSRIAWRRACDATAFHDAFRYRVIASLATHRRLTITQRRERRERRKRIPPVHGNKQNGTRRPKLFAYLHMYPCALQRASERRCEYSGLSLPRRLVTRNCTNRRSQLLRLCAMPQTTTATATVRLNHY